MIMFGNPKVNVEKRNKLSHSSVSIYSECGKKYKLHYIDRIRAKDEKSALYFGKCLDNAFNELLAGKDLALAQANFEIEWTKALEMDIKYSKSDVDEDLLAWVELPINKKQPAWATLRLKGALLVKAYHDQVLPKIKKVIAVQKPVSIKNAEGDEVAGFLDLIVEWEDGKTYLMDNKSSSVPYTPTSAKESQQLVLYYHMEKDTYKLDGVGFIVLSKKIIKNKLKTCTKCGNETTGREKTCTRLENGVRCNGEFSISFNPEVEVQFIINEVDEAAEDRCIEVFDKTNEGLLNEKFDPNWQACIGKYGKCTYFDYCKKGSMDGLVKKEEKSQ
jgi:hypothetical protein